MSTRTTQFVAYYRVSTQRQGATGLGLEAQKAAVQAFVTAVGAQILGEFQEVESGGLKSRPMLNEAIRTAKALKATLVIAKLDRLARNVSLVSQLMDSGVDFVAADMPYANRLTVHIIAAVAEYEREMIGARTKAALQRAKARGVVLGNPNAASQARAAGNVAKQKADVFAKVLAPQVTTLRAGGASLRQIATSLDAHGVSTQRGKRWTAAGVANVLSRLSSPESTEVAAPRGRQRRTAIK